MLYGNAQIIAMKDENTLAVEACRFRGNRFKVRMLILMVVLSGSSLFAQTADKPKAFLFDEFEKFDNREINLRTKKLEEKIKEKAWSKEPFSAYVVIFSDEKNSSTRLLEKRIIDALFDDCRDCMGLGGPRITFVRAGKAKRQKVQFWLIPSGAEPPAIDNSED
jgi:hypothetical protein